MHSALSQSRPRCRCYEHLVALLTSALRAWVPQKPEVPESLVQRLAAPVQRLAGLPVRDPDALEVEAGVKDYGMALLTALVPEVSWQGGGAQVVLHVRGTMRAPLVEGFADIERGSVKCSVVKVRPLPCASRARGRLFPGPNVTGHATYGRRVTWRTSRRPCPSTTA